MLITLHQQDMVGFTENLPQKFYEGQPSYYDTVWGHEMESYTRRFELPNSIKNTMEVDSIKNYISGILDGSQYLFYNAKVEVGSDNSTLILRYFKKNENLYGMSISEYYNKNKDKVETKVMKVKKELKDGESRYAWEVGELEDLEYTGLFIPTGLPYNSSKHFAYGSIVDGDNPLSKAITYVSKKIMDVSYIWIQEIENNKYKLATFGESFPEEFHKYKDPEIMYK